MNYGLDVIGVEGQEKLVHKATELDQEVLKKLKVCSFVITQKKLLYSFGNIMLKSFF